MICMKAVAKIPNLLLLIVLGMSACGPDARDRIESNALEIVAPREGEIRGEIRMELRELEASASVEFSGAQPLRSEGHIYYFKFEQAGLQTINILTRHGEEERSGRHQIAIYPAAEASPLEYQIIAVHPHRSDSYTQGLEVRGDTVYESSGQYGASRIQRYLLNDGKLLSEQELPVNHFGEGLSRMGDTLYQLTWREGICYLYDGSLNRLGTLPLPTAEGWGLCNDEKRLYLSDGSHRLQVLNPQLRIEQTLQIFNGKAPLNQLNELEYAESKIWANVYQSERIYLINPQTGAAEHYIDLSELRRQLSAPQAEVLNGIAYRQKTNTLLISGKYWDKTFEIRPVLPGQETL